MQGKAHLLNPVNLHFSVIEMRTQRRAVRCRYTGVNGMGLRTVKDLVLGMLHGFLVWGWDLKTRINVE